MESPPTLSYAVNCSILFQDLPIAERAAAARDAGFSAVEFWWPFASPTPSDADVSAFCDAIEVAGLQLVALNTYAGNMGDGERGIASLPGRESEFRENLEVVVRIARHLGCGLFNVLYGNQIDGVSAGSQHDLGMKNLLHASSVLSACGGTVLIESLSGIPSYPLKTAADSIDVIDHARQLGAKNMRFLLDTYHLAANGDDPYLALQKYAPHVGHVQIADAPGRGAPGTGTIDMAVILRGIAELDPSPWVSLEYLASTNGDVDPFIWLPRELRSSI